MAKKILISGYYGFNNSGDDAILKILVDQLKLIEYPVEIVALSNNVEQTELEYKVRAINRYNLSTIIKEMKDCDLFISGGGTLLQDGTSNRSLYYYLTILKLAKKYCYKTMIFANGMGPIKSKFNKKLTKNLLEQVDYITLRDYNSLEFLKTLGLRNKNVEVTFDPVFMMKPIDDFKILEIFKEENINIDKKCIAISVRNWDHLDDIKDNVVNLIKKLEMNFEILLVPMQHPNDDILSKNIIKMSKCKDIKILKNHYNADELIGIMSKMDYVIAMRYHALIYATISQIPITAIEYDPKVGGLMKMLNIDSVCSMAQIETRKLCNIVEKGLANKDESIEKLELGHNEKFQSAYRNIEIIRGLLEDN